MGLLDLFPNIKAYLIGTAAAGLLAGAIWYTYHEQSIGEQKIEAVQAKLAAVQAAHVKDVELLADNLHVNIETTYEAAIATPPSDSPHLLCQRAAAPAVVSGSAGRAAAVPGNVAADSAGGQQVDVGPPIDARSKAADDQIKALQADVKLLVDEMNGATK